MFTESIGKLSEYGDFSAHLICQMRFTPRVLPDQSIWASDEAGFCPYMGPARKLSNTLRQYLLEIREQPRGLLDDIEILVLGRIDPDGYGWV